MKIAEDLRRIARNALTNKWFIAVAVGLVASILGGVSSGGPEFKVNIDGNNASMNFNLPLMGTVMFISVVRIWIFT